MDYFPQAEDERTTAGELRLGFQIATRHGNAGACVSAMNAAHPPFRAGQFSLKHFRFLSELQRSWAKPNPLPDGFLGLIYTWPRNTSKKRSAGPHTADALNGPLRTFSSGADLQPAADGRLNERHLSIGAQRTNTLYKRTVSHRANGRVPDASYPLRKGKSDSHEQQEVTSESGVSEGSNEQPCSRSKMGDAAGRAGKNDVVPSSPELTTSERAAKSMPEFTMKTPRINLVARTKNVTARNNIERPSTGDIQQPTLQNPVVIQRTARQRQQYRPATSEMSAQLSSERPSRSEIELKPDTSGAEQRQLASTSARVDKPLQNIRHKLSNEPIHWKPPLHKDHIQVSDPSAQMNRKGSSSLPSNTAAARPLSSTEHERAAVIRADQGTGISDSETSVVPIGQDKFREVQVTPTFLRRLHQRSSLRSAGHAMPKEIAQVTGGAGNKIAPKREQKPIVGPTSPVDGSNHGSVLLNPQRSISIQAQSSASDTQPLANESSSTHLLNADLEGPRFLLPAKTLETEPETSTPPVWIPSSQPLRKRDCTQDSPDNLMLFRFANQLGTPREVVQSGCLDYVLAETPRFLKGLHSNSVLARKTPKRFPHAVASGWEPHRVFAAPDHAITSGVEISVSTAPLSKGPRAAVQRLSDHRVGASIGEPAPSINPHPSPPMVRATVPPNSVIVQRSPVLPTSYVEPVIQAQPAVTAFPPAAPQSLAGLNIPQLADQVYDLLTRRLAKERERRGT